MEINGLTLPASFVRAIEQGDLSERTKHWRLQNLREELDAYGNPLETELGAVYEDIASLQKETASLSKDFPLHPDDWDEMNRDQPGFIPYIKDFSKVVCFGMDGGGAPFCFDFRENQEEPSVIWWADAYWRRIAPNFQAFIGLFPAP
ncbi:MAG: SMI1/KNR4 family protein [Armatimonadetes bacterium]|nr:SMI1/KNR4 family protein [Armatimonadota bacterium]